MFEILKDKLFSSQPVELSDKELEEKLNIDLSVGADVLQRYQKSWKILHNASEDIVKQAERVDQLSERANSCFDNQWKNMNDLILECNALPDLTKDIHNAVTTMESLGGVFQELEKSLADLENVIEIQEMQKKQVNEKFQLVLHKEHRNVELQKLNMVLAANHQVKIRQHEKLQNSVLAERHVAFEKAFEDDLQHFVKYGKIERVSGVMANESGVKLEDVNIEQDNEELGAFLEDVNIEQDVQESTVTPDPSL